jgi:hypothetical protein
MIVFAQASGGAKELLEQTPHLLFDDAERAVPSIFEVMNSEDLQQSTLEGLEADSLRKLLTPDNFMARVREIVRARLNRSSKCDIPARTTCV